MQIIKIQCEVERPEVGRDEFTGKMPFALTDSQDVRIDLAMFRAGVLVATGEAFTVELINAAGTIAVSGAGLAQAVTLDQWKINGSPQVAFAWNTGTLPAGIYTLRVASTDTGSNAIFLNAPFEIRALTPVVGTSTTPSPPTAYTQAEANDLFFSKDDGETLEADFAALSTATIVRTSSQTFDATAKATARANIGAAGAGSHADLSAEMNPATTQAWRHTLTANTTLTASAWQLGIAYSVALLQDATGNRTVTWPATVVPTLDAVVNPAPSTLSEFQLVTQRGASSAIVCLKPLSRPDVPAPIYAYNPGNLARLGTSPAVWTDPVSGLVSTQSISGDRPTYTSAGIGGKRTAVFGGTKNFTLGATATTAALDVSSTAGTTVACVWDYTSNGTGEQFILSLGSLGLALRLTSGGNLAFGGDSPVTVACAKDTTPAVCVASWESGQPILILLRKGGQTYAAYAAAAAASASKTEWVAGREYNGTSHFQGRIGRLEIYDHALQFQQMARLLEKLALEFGL